MALKKLNTFPRSSGNDIINSCGSYTILMSQIYYFFLLLVVSYFYHIFFIELGSPMFFSFCSSVFCISVFIIFFSSGKKEMGRINTSRDITFMAYANIFWYLTNKQKIRGSMCENFTGTSSSSDFPVPHLSSLATSKNPTTAVSFIRFFEKSFFKANLFMVRIYTFWHKGEVA